MHSNDLQSSNQSSPHNPQKELHFTDIREGIDSVVSSKGGLLMAPAVGTVDSSSVSSTSYHEQVSPHFRPKNGQNTVA